MTRVLLVNPSWDRYVSRKGRRINRAWPPLDLLNCAALLKKDGIAVDLIDARAAWLEPEAIARQADAYDMVFVTSSPLDRWQCPNLELSLFFERLKPFRHPALYVMGIHGTQHPDLMLRETSAKAVICGEPEFIVLDIARGLPLAQIAGVAYTDDAGQLVRTPARPLADLTQFPVPDFSLLNLGLYGYELAGDRFVLLETTRGCPFPCMFCQRDMFGGRAYRYKTPAQVAAEVGEALARGARSGYFIDLEFSLNRDYTLQVCEAIRPYRERWTWCCQTRADSVDPELLRAMKDAGCALVHFGVESGSAKILAETQKKITLEKIAEGVAAVKAAGMDVACFFMLGLPGETDADREQTLAFARRINPTYASFHITSPYPNTPLYAAQTWDQPYPESVLRGDALRALKRWERRAYWRFYVRWGYVASFFRRGRFAPMFKQARLLWQLL